MATDPRALKAPKVSNITVETIFSQFDSLLLLDAGSGGFRLKDSRNNVITIPTGIPISIAAQAGMASGPITVQAPASGSLNVSAIYYD
jgi:hypothetical protein